MPIINIESINDQRVAVYASLTDRQLRSRIDASLAVYIAESPKVINVALNVGLRPLSLLCERRHIEGDAASIIERCPDIPVYTADRDILASLTGYTLTRGVLAVFPRPAHIPAAELLRDARRVVVIDNVVDSTNVGAIFRSAAALGADAVVLTPTACDPLNRRALRVSMGTVLQVPWTFLDSDDVNGELAQSGFKTVALALTPRSTLIDDPRIAAEERVALILGTEGEGLPKDVIEHADYTVMIPMAHGVDSLNVAAASAVAIYALWGRTAVVR